MRTLVIALALVLLSSIHIGFGQRQINCGNNVFSDINGCCPIRLNESNLLYADARGCYPILTAAGIQYADLEGCYPNPQVPDDNADEEER